MKKAISKFVMDVTTLLETAKSEFSKILARASPQPVTRKNLKPRNLESYPYTLHRQSTLVCPTPVTPLPFSPSEQ